MTKSNAHLPAGWSNPSRESLCDHILSYESERPFRVLSENNSPSSLTILARRLTHSNHFQGALFGILAFYKSNTAFGVQSLAGFVLSQVNTASNTTTMAVLPIWIRLAQRFHQHLQGITSLPCYARACQGAGIFLQLCLEAVSSILTVSRFMGIYFAR